MDTQDEQPHMHGVTNQQWSDLSSLLSTIPEEWPNPSESSSSSSSDEEDSREASSSSTLPSVCNYNEACPELGSRCVRGYETCFGKTYHSFICDCAENDTGDLVYDCDFTDACAGASSSASSSSSSGDQHVTETTEQTTASIASAPVITNGPTKAPTTEDLRNSVVVVESCFGKPCPFDSWCRSRYGSCGPGYMYCNSYSSWDSSCIATTTTTTTTTTATDIATTVSSTTTVKPTADPNAVDDSSPFLGAVDMKELEESLKEDDSNNIVTSSSPSSLNNGNNNNNDSGNNEEKVTTPMTRGGNPEDNDTTTTGTGMTPGLGVGIGAIVLVSLVAAFAMKWEWDSRNLG